MSKIAKNISCVLFDLDGVLIDACEWHFESLNRALYEVVGKKISRIDHETRFNGLPTKTKLKMLGVDDDSFEKIWQLKQAYTIDEIEANSSVSPEKIELLSFLRNKNVKLACVTNSIRQTATKMLSHAGQIGYFDAIITNEDVLKNKPSPDCYNFAIQVLKSNPDETLCVEDSEKGIEAAKNSLAKYTWEVTGYDQVTLANYFEFIK